MIQFKETLYKHWSQAFKIRQILHHECTTIQDLTIFESETFGRVLALDGIIQTTEADEPYYHEMMVHVPLLAHGSAQSVCVIGGGDGGVLREVLKHQAVEAILVEIDMDVIEASRRHLPTISLGSFDDPRVAIVVSDGARYMAESTSLFDIIIVDSTDPQGLGETLFLESFYVNCRRHLQPGGILVTQSGIPFMQPDEVRCTYQRLKPYFDDVRFFVTAVPTYVGGLMTLGWASLDPAYRTCSRELIQARATQMNLDTRYYTPDIHIASFALPRYIERLIGI